jgi:glycosyltransferase involved in cell wall biosynthesis
VASASEREGYGLIVVEAAARGTPSVVAAGPENAAAELVVDGVNGTVAPEATPDSIGRAIVQVVQSGTALRESTLRWFIENAEDLRIERSVELVTRSYAGDVR